MKAAQPAFSGHTPRPAKNRSAGKSALQRAADQSTVTHSLNMLQRMADQNVHANAVQRMEEDELQGKFIQRMEDEEALQGKSIQRMEEDEPMQGKAVQLMEDEELLQGKAIQRVEDEELMQGKSIQRVADEELLQGKAIQRVEAPRTNNTGLPDNLKAGIESLSGMSMDHVQVHRNSDKPAAVQAHAYAQGSDIHLGPGQEQHLPHEAWHVVQQAQGRVKPTMQLKGVAVNDDLGLEREADVMGAKAMTMQSFGSESGGRQNRSSPTNAALQRLMVPNDHIRADLRHPKASSLFEDYTFEDIEDRLGGPIADASNADVEQAVEESRAAEMTDYRVLSQRKITSEKQMTAFLNDKTDDEHMYVLDDSELHVATRAESKKLPHPTLVGGDPDVECAGTLLWGLDGSVLVTSESGHFRPPSEGPGKKFVQNMMAKTTQTSFKKKVKGKKRR